jgi:hypothetical protein
MFFLVFSSFRLCSTIFYDAAVIHSQIILINRRILQVCGDNPGFDKFNIEERIHYQNEIFKTLCCCIEHHVTVTRLGGVNFEDLLISYNFTECLTNCSIM